MARENEHIRTLYVVRQTLVQERRVVVKELAKAYKPGQTEKMRDLFNSIAATINSIDHAINDEATTAADTQPKSSLSNLFR